MRDTDARERVSLARRILRVLGINSDLAQSHCTQEDQNSVDFSTDYYNTWRTVEIALLETERRKTEALTERQRRSFVQ